MPAISVQITQYTSDAQPGFVIAQLIDAFGRTHQFHDKVPVFCSDSLDRDSRLPVPGELDCEIIERFIDNGRELVRIDTEKPFDVESTDGCYQFVVPVDLIIEDSNES